MCIERNFFFRSRVLIFTASCFFVSLGSLRIRELLHRIFGVVNFFSESKICENFCVNLFQSDLTSIGRTENHFRAAQSSVVWVEVVRLCIQLS